MPGRSPKHWFGTSPQLIVTPTSSTAAITAALVLPLAAGGDHRYLALASTLAILTGFALLLLGVFRLGFVSQLVATSVQFGFMFGIGLVIALDQSFSLLGIASDQSDFVPKLLALLSHLGDTHAWTAAVGVESLAALLAVRHSAPRAPAALIVVAMSIVLVILLGLESQGVATVGHITGGLP